jgi:hypothetical protein
MVGQGKIRIPRTSSKSLTVTNPYFTLGKLRIWPNLSKPYFTLFQLAKIGTTKQNLDPRCTRTYVQTRVKMNIRRVK